MNTVLGYSVLLLLCASCVIVVIAAVHDIAFRTIPDGLSIGMAVLGLARGVICGVAGQTTLIAVGVFLLAMLCWRCQWLGGGDAKLLAAASAGIPAASVLPFIAAVALSGGVLALVYLTSRTFFLPRPSPRPTNLASRIGRAERWRLSRGGPLPYACAIATGYFFAAF